MKRNLFLPVALLALCGVVAPGAQDVSLESVMAKATIYVATFVERFSNVVTEERYSQAVRGPGRGSGGSGSSSMPGAAGDPLIIPVRRELRSDLIIVRDATVFGWIMLRDVFEVD